ncbi:MAG: hypothetical protein ACE5HF_09795 [Gemmatimonadota bacterium]
MRSARLLPVLVVAAWACGANGDAAADGMAVAASPLDATPIRELGPVAGDSAFVRRLGETWDEACPRAHWSPAMDHLRVASWLGPSHRVVTSSEAGIDESETEWILVREDRATDLKTWKKAFREICGA